VARRRRSHYDVEEVASGCCVVEEAVRGGDMDEFLRRLQAGVAAREISQHGGGDDDGKEQNSWGCEVTIPWPMSKVILSTQPAHQTTFEPTRGKITNDICASHGPGSSDSGHAHEAG
jgi:hypothetical protein